MKPSEDLIISLHDESNQFVSLSKDALSILEKMCHAHVEEDLHTEDVLSRTVENAVLTVKMDDLVDLEEEKEKLSKEVARLEKEIKRASGMLANPNFTSKAPQAKVDQEKEKLAKYQEQYEMTKVQLNDILEKLK